MSFDERASGSADEASRAKPSEPGGSDFEREEAGIQVSLDPGQLSELLRGAPEHGHIASRYEVEEAVGRGGMGIVLRVRDRELRRKVAMKILDTPDARAAADAQLTDRRLRFLQEAQITGQLDHPGIVPVHELGRDADGRLCFTMKLVRGRTLTRVFELAREGQEEWTQERVLRVMLKVCMAMAFAHSRGAIHRDLKPSNIMVGRFGETYVMDWGLARLIGRPEGSQPVELEESSLLHSVREELNADPDSPLVTAKGRVVGTPPYMAPEQAAGRVDELGPRSDIYSFGATLYQMLVGHPPYCPPGAVLSQRTILESVISGPPKPIARIRPETPADLVAICEKAMARDPSRRYADMREVAADIEAFLDRRPIRAHPGILHTVALAIRRHRAVAITASVACVALLVLGTWFLVRLADSRRSAQRLSDLLAARALVEEERETLTPRVPTAAPQTRRWEVRVADLLQRAPGYGAAADAGNRMPPLEPEEVASLVGMLDDLAIRRRRVLEELEVARTLIAEPDPALQERWAPVFADLDDDARFADLDRVPQPGLLPLARNSAGYWQFLLVGSGAAPAMAEGRPVIDDRSGIVMVLLPGGELTLGYDRGESNEVPHRVTLRPFLLAAHEITQAQWLWTFGDNPSKRRDGVTSFGVLVDRRHPVECITWHEAVRFASCCGARLPSKDELEYAGRAGRPGPWFDGSPPEELEGRENLLDELRDQWAPLGTPPLPWTDGYPEHAPAGSFAPNSFGLFDVGGNLSEWTSDYYHPTGTEADRPEPTDGHAISDRTRLREIRGANFGIPVNRVRASYRQYYLPGYLTHWVGARLARSWMTIADVTAARSVSRD